MIVLCGTCHSLVSQSSCALMSSNQIFEVLEEPFVWYDKPVYNVARVVMVIPDMCQGRLLFHLESKVVAMGCFFVGGDILSTLQSVLMSLDSVQILLLGNLQLDHQQCFPEMAIAILGTFVCYERPLLVEPEKNLHFVWTVLSTKGRHCHPEEWISFLVGSSGIVCHQRFLTRW